MLLIPVSIADIFDKITILDIKTQKIKEHKREIKKELALLRKTVAHIDVPIEIIAELKTVNAQIWDLENSVRMHERMFDFGQDFIDDARQIFNLNNRRSEIKREINRFTSSDIVEYKKHV